MTKSDRSHPRVGRIGVGQAGIAPQARARAITRTTALLAILGASAGASAGAGCAGRTPSSTGALAKSPLSREQENQIGAQIKAELDQKQRVQYLDDSAVVDYVRGTARKVITVANNGGHDDSADLNWQVNVIDDSRTVNAFGTPGGYLYVYTGLLAVLDDEAELAGILAHEVGHMVAQHTLRNLTATYSLDAVKDLAAGQNPGLLTQLATTISSSGFLLAHQRSDETVADELGARYADTAGYDPRAMVEFFRVLQKQQETLPGGLAFLTDHPSSGDRVSHLEKYLSENRLGNNARGKTAFLPVKQRVLAHAAGPSGAAAVEALSQSAPPPPPAPPAGIRPASSKTPAAPRAGQPGATRRPR
jgi:predicted Zn-dependent protease